jgi:acyl carrier protein
LTDILKQEAIIKTVIVIVEDLVQDWELNFDEAIDQQTFLVNDLNFSSVDIIQLCVALEQNYECKLGFHELLMEDGKYVGDLSIKQISIFLESKLKNNQENRLE